MCVAIQSSSKSVMRRVARAARRALSAAVRVSTAQRVRWSPLVSLMCMPLEKLGSWRSWSMWRPNTLALAQRSGVRRVKRAMRPSWQSVGSYGGTQCPLARLSHGLVWTRLADWAQQQSDYRRGCNLQQHIGPR